MSPTRWYLTRETFAAGYPFAVVVEELAETKRGVLCDAVDRHDARRHLGPLRETLAERLARKPPTVVYSPVEIEAP